MTLSGAINIFTNQKDGTFVECDDCQFAVWDWNNKVGTPVGFAGLSWYEKPANEGITGVNNDTFVIAQSSGLFLGGWGTLLADTSPDITAFAAGSILGSSNDNRSDLVYYDNNSQNLTVLFNSASQTGTTSVYTDSSSYDSSWAPTNYLIGNADQISVPPVQKIWLNGTNPTNIIVAQADTLNSYAFLPSSATPFQGPTQVAAGIPLPSITVIVDLNGDQVPDIVSDRIYLGKGNGAFVAVAYPSVTPATTLGTAAIAMADFNNDSKMDLAILDGNGTLEIFFGPCIQ
jgi:hypothetical protein